MSNHVLPLSLSIALSATLAACATGAPTEPSTALEGPAAAEASSRQYSLDDEVYVLLWSDAALYRSVDDSEPVRAYDYGEDAREDRPGEVYVARLVSERGEWLEVVTGPIDWLTSDGQSRHCIGSGLFFNQSSEDEVSGEVSLNLWVKREDVAPVLTRCVLRIYDDGTIADVRPGTPIVGGKPWLSEGFLLPFDVDEAVVGERYTPDPSRIDPEKDFFPLTEVLRVEAQLGNEAVSWAQTPWDYNEMPWLPINRSRTHIRLSEKGCGTVELAFLGELPANEDEDEVRAGGGLLLGGVAGAEQSARAEIPAQTPLTWDDGRPAGTTQEVVRLRGDAPAEDGRVCFELRVGAEWKSAGYQNDRLRVCAPQDSVVRPAE